MENKTNKAFNSQENTDPDSPEYENLVLMSLQNKDAVKLIQLLKNKFPQCSTKELYDSFMELQWYIKDNNTLSAALHLLKTEGLNRGNIVDN